MIAALRDRDTAALRKVVHPSLRVMTASDANGESVLALQTEEFIHVVGQATGPAWNQHLVRPDVRIDGRLASIWSRYRFDRGDVFDHCGVIALHLVRIGNTWTIAQLSDTHRWNDCG